jgi:hypothetical protein
MAGRALYDEGEEFKDRLFLAKRVLGSDSLPGPLNWLGVRYYG